MIKQLLTLTAAAITSQTAFAAESATVSPPAPFQPVPNAAQMRWHKAEYIMMACFGMKTFHPSGNHMGDGKEDPKSFNPVKFDAGQWVAAAKAGGFKGIVLTTKHHEGFAIWQSETTDFDLGSTSWQGGKGDVVRDLGHACRKEGIYFGLYASILDMNYENNKTTKFAKYANYGDFYFDQLKELSTKYGTVDEYWFDGFNAANLKIDYAKIAKMINETQPEAVIYDSGMLVKHLPDRCLAWPGAHGGVRPEQEYRQKIDGKMRWYPNEPSIIFQGNWYHHGSPSISARQMQDCYLTSTGHGVTPLMNVPPNADGLIDEDTVTKLKEFKAWVDQLNANNLAKAPGTKVSDSGHRGNDAKFAADKAVDSDYDTYFATDDSTTTATIEVTFDKPKKIGGFILQEYIPLGQRVDGYSIECRVDGKWIEVFAGKKIGYKRIILEGRSSAPALSFNEGNIDVLKIKSETKTKPGTGKLTLPTADAVRLKIINAQACPLINNFQVLGEGHCLPASLTEGKPATASSQWDGNYSADRAFDGDDSTRWSTAEGQKTGWLEVDLGKPTVVSRAVINEGWDRIRKFTFQRQVGNDWKTLAEGTTIGANREFKFAPVTAQKFRLEILDSREPAPTIFEMQLY